MINHPKSHQSRLRRRLIAIQLAVTLGAMLVAEAIVVVGVKLAEPGMAVNWLRSGASVALAALLAGVLAAVLGRWATRWLVRRLGETLDITQSWLRGNLSLRLETGRTDELSLLASHLNLLAEQLEKDEQDLETLRERNTLLTDQVRALAVVEERNRLPRELHDSVKQHLFSLNMTASAIQARLDSGGEPPADLREMVREVQASAQTAQREMTRLIDDLRPSSLQERGLSRSLDDLTLLMGARERLLIYLEVQGNDAVIPAAIAECLYLVSQEALHNVARHSRATRADALLQCIPEQVLLSIRDNGIGFDTSQTRRGLGLSNMQERLLSVGGRLVVESQTGTGTLVLAQVGLTPVMSTVRGQAGRERDRPRPTVENWSWLGQRLVVPVGQTWPWLPAEYVHLRQPLVPSGSNVQVVHRSGRFFGLGRNYDFVVDGQRRPLLRVHASRSGYEWEADGASWALRRIRGLSGRAVLTRDGQPMAAMQYQGRLLHTWTDVIYAGRGYRLVRSQDPMAEYVLSDETDDRVFVIRGDSPLLLRMRRTAPWPLVMMATMRHMDAMEAGSPQVPEEVV